MGFCIICSERWTSKSLAHCTACHRTFGGVGGFDKHRDNGRCIDPMELGMEIKERTWVRKDTKFADGKPKNREVSR